MMLRAALVVVLVILAVSGTGPPWRLGAWNIRQFGQATMRRQGVPEVLKAVMSRYDLVVIQEVQDSYDKAVPELSDIVNNGRNPNDKFTYKLSDQKHRNGKKIERYAVFYRPSRISVVEAITYNGPLNKFTYPPYMLVLEVNDGNTFKFGMIVLHTRPTLAAQEMNNLAQLSRDFQHDKKLAGVLIGGDLNAGSNIKKADWDNLILRDNDFKWFIDSDMNTSTYGCTKSGDNRPYDRIIGLGAALLNRIDRRTSGAYCFDRDSNTPNAAPVPPLPSDASSCVKADVFGEHKCVPRRDAFGDFVKRRVSDHYPVEVKVL